MDINLLTFTYPINGQYISKRLSLLEIYEKKKSNSPVESEERVLHVRIIVRIIVLAQSLTRMSLRVIRPVRLVPQCKY